MEFLYSSLCQRTSRVHDPPSRASFSRRPPGIEWTQPPCLATQSALVCMREPELHMSTILFTSCSSGFGLATARYLLDRDRTVVAKLRTPSRDLLYESDRLHIVALDVTVVLTGPIPTVHHTDSCLVTESLRARLRNRPADGCFGNYRPMLMLLKGVAAQRADAANV